MPTLEDLFYAVILYYNMLTGATLRHLTRAVLNKNVNVTQRLKTAICSCSATPGAFF